LEQSDVSPGKFRYCDRLRSGDRARKDYRGTATGCPLQLHHDLAHLCGGARGCGARGADFARGRGAPGAGQRPLAPCQPWSVLHHRLFPPADHDLSGFAYATAERRLGRADSGQKSVHSRAADLQLHPLFWPVSSCTVTVGLPVACSLSTARERDGETVTSNSE
jgi:hypothetical protein